MDKANGRKNLLQAIKGGAVIEAPPMTEVDPYIVHHANKVARYQQLGVLKLAWKCDPVMQNKYFCTFFENYPDGGEDGRKGWHALDCIVTFKQTHQLNGKISGIWTIFRSVPNDGCAWTIEVHGNIDLVPEILKFAEFQLGQGKTFEDVGVVLV